MSEPVVEQQPTVEAPVSESVPATTAVEETAAPAVTSEEAPKAEEPTSAPVAEAEEPAAAAVTETPKSEKRKSKIFDLFNKIKVSIDLMWLFARQNGLWKFKEEKKN
jgi:hypothetical protein